MTARIKMYRSTRKIRVRGKGGESAARKTDRSRLLVKLLEIFVEGFSVSFLVGVNTDDRPLFFHVVGPRGASGSANSRR